MSNNEFNQSSNAFKFSIVMAVYNVEDYLEEAIDSVINQTLSFEENIQLILVDDGSSDNSRDIALNYQSKYPNNIEVISKENGGVASARNLGLKHVNGDYVNFMDSDDKFSLNAFEKVYDFIENHDGNDFDVISIPVVFFDAMSGDHYLNYKFDMGDVVDLVENPDCYEVYTHSIFVKREAIGNFEFDSRLINMEDALFINKIILDKMKVGLVKDCSYLYRKRFDDTAILSTAHQKKEYFTDRLKYLYLELINYSLDSKGVVPKFIQNLLVYDLHWMMKIEDISDIFDDKEELDEFWLYLEKVLSHLDSDVIKEHKFVPRYIKSFMVYVKNNYDFHIEFDNGKVLIKSLDYTINNINRQKIVLDIIEMKDGFLNVSGYLKTNCLSSVIFIEAIKTSKSKKETYVAKDVEYPNTNRKDISLLSNPWVFYKNFDLKIPIRKNEDSNIFLRVKYSENNNVSYLENKLSFAKHANLSSASHYLIKDSRILLFKSNGFFIMPYSYKNVLKNEVYSIKKILRDRKPNFMDALSFRLAYLALLPFMRNKRIWLFEDVPEVADNNAKYLYSYSKEKEDNIQKYFVLDKGCKDYKKMQKVSKSLVNFASLKHKLLYVFAEKVIFSYPDYRLINPFFEDRDLYNGLSAIDSYYIANGIIAHDVSWQFRKFYYNFSLFLTSSIKERDYLLGDDFNYDDEVIQLLGLPRYDTLDNKDSKKQILFMPTYRRTLKKRDALDFSDYLKRINSFINNERLIKFLNESGYELIFKPHYELLPNVDLFDSQNVKLGIDESYQDLFNESVILITDYSSVAFDFAYLKKPVIYYHNGDDYHNEKAYFDYETMGFGDITYNEDELVNRIIEYIENGCAMEDEFKERVDEFFEFKDKNNCKRVYEWLISH